jgi:hypothetical protein
VKQEPSSPPPKKRWWELELETLLGDFPGEELAVAQSVNEDYKQLTLNDVDAVLWSARDHDANYVDLAASPHRPAEVKEEEEDWEDFTDDDDSRRH